MKKTLEKTCRKCKDHTYIATGKNNDFCTLKFKFINYKKPCRKYDNNIEYLEEEDYNEK